MMWLEFKNRCTWSITVSSSLFFDENQHSKGGPGSFQHVWTNQNLLTVAKPWRNHRSWVSIRPPFQAVASGGSWQGSGRFLWVSQIFEWTQAGGELHLFSFLIRFGGRTSQLSLRIGWTLGLEDTSTGMYRIVQVYLMHLDWICIEQAFRA